MLSLSAPVWTHSEIKHTVRYLNSSQKRRRSLAAQRRRDWHEMLNAAESGIEMQALATYWQAEELKWEQFSSLVRSWIASNHDIGELLEANPELRQMLSMLRLNIRPYVSCSKDGALVLYPFSDFPTSDDPVRRSRQEARIKFLELIAQPNSRRWGLCDRCGRFYVAKRARPNKRYCTSRCGTRATAAEAMRAARKAEKKKKLDAIRRVDRNRPAKAAVELLNAEGVTLHFITRALHSGTLADIESWFKPYLEKGLRSAYASYLRTVSRGK